METDPRVLAAKRAALRAALKEEFRMKFTNPHDDISGGYIFDSAIQRYNSMQVRSHDFFRPNPKNALIAFFVVVFPIMTIGWFFKTTRDAKEHLYRTGQVAYRDRDGKFK